MATKISILALLLAIVAIGVAAIGRSPDRAGPSVSDSRLSAIEERVAVLAREIEELNARSPDPRGLEGSPGRAPGTASAIPGESLDAADAAPTSGRDLEEIVDAAVEKKAREVVDELETKKNKEPSIDVFASTLELTESQRRAVEREVLRAQGEIRALMETPTADGANFMDELVEVYAKKIAKPGEDPGWNRWIMRLVSQRVPGTDETYAERAEAVKESLRAAFRRDFTKEQYAEFEAWGMDPTEIKGIEGSPYEDIGRRIADRARQLGAEIPEEGGD